MQTGYTNFVTSLVITREIWKQVMPRWDDMLLIKKKKWWDDMFSSLSLSRKNESVGLKMECSSLTWNGRGTC